jgi:FSR family fosmidomycin resistance protein-like MFS transporter
MSITGLAPNYSLLLAFVLLSGFGVSSFHPEGFKTAYFFTGEKKATGMSIFAVGGNLGMALGPILSLGLVSSFGLHGTLGMIAPGILMVVILLWSLSWLTAPVHSAFREKIREGGQPLSKQEWISLILLISIVTLRSWIQMGLITYIPFYYIDYLKGTPLYAGKLVSTFLLAGAFGTLIGAPIADRWGHKNYVLITMALTLPLLLLFYNTSGPLAFVVLGVTGMVIISSFTVTTVMAQILLPHRLGMVAGLMVGFAIGTGGVGVTLLGTIADIWGVPAAMKTILGIPFVAVGLIWLLEYPPKKAE